MYKSNFKQFCFVITFKNIATLYKIPKQLQNTCHFVTFDLHQFIFSKNKSLENALPLVYTKELFGTTLAFTAPKWHFI